jgi:hypothetical protein
MSSTLTNLLLFSIDPRITPVKKRRYIIFGPDGKPWDIDLYEEENSFLLTGEREAKSIDEQLIKAR